MLQMTIKEFSRDEWTDITKDFSDLSLLQSWEYAQAKADTGGWEVVRAVFLKNNCIVGACQGMKRRVPYTKIGIVWINRGPLWRKEGQTDHSLLGEILGQLKRHWVEKQRYYLRVSPPILKEEADAGIFSKYGYVPAEKNENWASARIDLSLPLEQLWAGMRENWRRHLKKTKLLGLTADCGTEENIFNQVLSEYQKMVLERKLSGSASVVLLSKLQSYLDKEHKLLALVGRQNKEILGGMLIARYGKTCEYLAGGFSSRGKDVFAGHFLMWQAICKAKESGALWFDLGGMHPLQTPPGIFHFKSGFGGSPYQLFGELESFQNNLANKAIRWRINRMRKAARNKGNDPK